MHQKAENLKNTIGIVGGVGPYAGIDLLKKIFDLTPADCDQQHLPVVLASFPSMIVDRTQFLLGKKPTNPGGAIAEIILKLEKMGCTLTAIACNTAHAPEIFDVILAKLSQSRSQVKVINMVEEVGKYLLEQSPAIRTVGILGTTGLIEANVYPRILKPTGLRLIHPDEDVQQQWVHQAIYHPGYGIKSQSNPVRPEARAQLIRSVRHLKDKGAEAIVMACTEIPLALSEDILEGTRLIDSTSVLAGSILREAMKDPLYPQ